MDLATEVFIYHCVKKGFSHYETGIYSHPQIDCDTVESPVENKGYALLNVSIQIGGVT